MKSRLSYALDVAGLAAGRVMYDETLRDEMAAKFFAANFLNNYMNASVTGPVVIYDDQENTIQLDAVATMGTSLMSVLGLSDMNVSGSSTVKLSSVNIEVTVVLDVTGSMGGQKIADLKAAAKDLVDIVVQDVQEPHFSKVALVPYSMPSTRQRWPAAAPCSTTRSATRRLRQSSTLTCLPTTWGSASLGANELSSAFIAIGTQLSNLRLAK